MIEHKTEKKLRVDSEKREIPVHIRLGFPIGILTSRFTEDTYDFVDWHWHEEVQYIVVLEGAFCFHIADKKHEVSQGNGIFINAHQIHKAEALNANSTYFFIYFHPSLLTSEKESYIYKSYISAILSDDFTGSIILNKGNEIDRRILDTILEMKYIYHKQDSFFELDILSSLFQLWKYTLACAQKKSLIKASNDLLTNNRLKEIISFINDNYASILTLEDIARHVNISRSECCRFFKACVGQSLFQYILHYRINKSVELLINTDMSIANISLEVGFNSQSYYTKCFTSMKEKTPSQMRKQYKNKEMEKEYLDRINNIK